MEEIIEKIEEIEIDSELVTNDDGSQEEVYRDPRSGNIVTHPSLRSPNGSVKDPRSDICWEEYMKGWRLGRPNAIEAARFAGYAPNTCANITNQKWFKERKTKLRDSKMMSNSERNLQRIVNLGLTRLKKLDDGTEEEVFDIEKARLVADISKFIVTTLGKDKYSTKTEVRVTALPAPILQLDAIDITTPFLEDNEPNVE